MGGKENWQEHEVFAACSAVSNKVPYLWGNKEMNKIEKGHFNMGIVFSFQYYLMSSLYCLTIKYLEIKKKTVLAKVYNGDVQRFKNVH